MREENGRLKRLVADLSVDRQILQEIVSKKLRPRVWRKLARWAQEAYRIKKSRTRCEFGLKRTLLETRS